MLVIPALSAMAAGAAVADRAGQAGRPAAASGGSLVGWGDNESGQLADGTRTNRDVPVTIKLPAGVKIASVRGSCAHALALTTDGRVLQWGTFALGQARAAATTADPSTADPAAAGRRTPGVIFPPAPRSRPSGPAAGTAWP